MAAFLGGCLLFGIRWVVEQNNGETRDDVSLPDSLTPTHSLSLRREDKKARPSNEASNSRRDSWKGQLNLCEGELTYSRPGDDDPPEGVMERLWKMLRKMPWNLE